MHYLTSANVHPLPAQKAKAISADAALMNFMSFVEYVKVTNNDIEQMRLAFGGLTSPEARKALKDEIEDKMSELKLVVESYQKAHDLH